MHIYGRQQLREDLITALATGLGFVFLAAPMLLIAFGGTLIWRLGGWSGAPSWRYVVALPVIVLASYALGAFAVGVCLFLLRPLRSSLLGWLITGYVAGVLAYGSAGVAGVLGYQWLDVNLFDFRSPAEGWRSIPEIAGICGVVGLSVAGAWWFKQRRRSKAA